MCVRARVGFNATLLIGYVLLEHDIGFHLDSGRCGLKYLILALILTQPGGSESFLSFVFVLLE